MSSSKSTDKAAEEVKAGKVEETVESGVKPESKKSVDAQEEVKAATKKKDQTEAKTVKKPQKKTPAKKTADKKTADKPELKPEVYIEYQGQQVMETAVIDKVKAAYVASGHRVSSIKSMQIYMKPEEQRAYYVINNGKNSGAVDLF